MDGMGLEGIMKGWKRLSKSEWNQRRGFLEQEVWLGRAERELMKDEKKLWRVKFKKRNLAFFGIVVRNIFKKF